MINKVDIKSGEHSYGQQLELERLCKKLSESPPDTHEQICLSMLDVLDINYKSSYEAYKEALEYVVEVLEGIKYWFERMRKALTYEPSTDEKIAGYSEMVKKVGSFGTIKALAKDFGILPDDVLKLPWMQVFTILATDKIENDFRRKLMENAARRSKGNTSIKK